VAEVVVLSVKFTLVIKDIVSECPFGRNPIGVQPAAAP
jgi:hypothetical protein